jgi:hypothetical protein
LVNQEPLLGGATLDFFTFSKSNQMNGLNKSLKKELRK